ncbi:transglutaminaseTgpA domain-containing protein [Marinobacter lacisalsi]|uniref:TransglutaminaseTgpA domain-containing protein n=1 Tax=Marinobacter lacisalsi TaxID=475979 RepID=A0ABV8QLN3_9GAMM
MSVRAPMLPSGALLWLLSGFVVLLLPQWDRLPPWLIMACLLLAGWRWLVQQGRVRLPGRWLRLLVMGALIAAYVATVSGHFSVDTAASFFVLAVGLKWLETRDSRDFFVLFFILIYLAAVNFLFKQGIGWTLVTLAGVFILLVALNMLHTPGATRSPVTGLWRLGGMMLKTLPVVLALFIFFPRMAPLWSVPLVSGEARSGLSDSMTPGDISSLAQSSERVFRVTFGSDMPAHRDRYWRGLILDRFDGHTWSQWQEAPRTRLGRVDLDAGIGNLAANQYDVLMEASGQRWVYALDHSRAVSGNITEVPGELFRLARPADTSIRYRMAQEPATDDSRALSLSERRRYLQLPEQGNERSRQLARELAESADSDLAFANSILSRFREQPYFYTLRPPTMPDDPVDTLLFDAKRGFCAHYASATTFLLRTAGVPARVVAGYQGGSAGAGDAYLIVRQYDAHAWVEAWIEGRGWVRLDPTAAISPDRIESGLRDAMAEEGSFLEDDWASPQRYGDIAAVQWLSLQMDRVNYNWQRWVVGYQGQSQLDLMSRLPGNIGLKELGYITAVLVGLALLVAGVVAALRHGGGREADPVAVLVGRWVRSLKQQGVPVPPGSTPAQLASLTAHQAPGAGRLARAFARDLNNHYYGADSRRDRSGARKTLIAYRVMRRRLSAIRREIRRSTRNRHAGRPSPSSPQRLS